MTWNISHRTIGFISAACVALIATGAAAYFVLAPGKLYALKEQAVSPTGSTKPSESLSSVTASLNLGVKSCPQHAVCADIVVINQGDRAIDLLDLQAQTDLRFYDDAGQFVGAAPSRPPLSLIDTLPPVSPWTKLEPGARSEIHFEVSSIIAAETNTRKAIEPGAYGIEAHLLLASNDGMMRVLASEVIPLTIDQ